MSELCHWALALRMKAAAEAREKKAADVRVGVTTSLCTSSYLHLGGEPKVKLSTEMESKISAAESDIVKRKDDFVKVAGRC